MFLQSLSDIWKIRLLGNFFIFRDNWLIFDRQILRREKALYSGFRGSHLCVISHRQLGNQPMRLPLLQRELLPSVPYL